MHGYIHIHINTNTHIRIYTNLMYWQDHNKMIPYHKTSLLFVFNSSLHNAAYMRQWTGSALFRKWFVASSAPSHYLDQCCIIVIGPLGANFSYFTFIKIQNFSITKIHLKISPIAKFMGNHGAHLGPVGPVWAPCWPHEPCYQGSSAKWRPFFVQGKT